MSATSRRVSWTVCIVSSALLVLLLTSLPWGWGRGLSTPTPDELFSASQLAAHREFNLTQRYLALASTLLSVGVALGWLVAGLATPGRRRLEKLPGGWWSRWLVALLMVSASVALVRLPFSVWSHTRRVDFGLATSSRAEWFRDWLTGLGIDVIVLAVVLGVIGISIRFSAHWWPLTAGVALAALTFGGSFVYPLVVEPLFNNFVELEDAELREAVEQIAAAEGVGVSQVLVADASRRTTQLNAYVSGLGSSRRVVLYDTLLRAPRDEVKAVVAHELAHAKHHDVAIGTAMGALWSLVGCGVLGLVLLPRRGGSPRDSSACATTGLKLVVVLFLVPVLAQPVQGLISRSMEVRADMTALEATEDAGAQERLHLRLARVALRDPDPPKVLQWWWGSHPTTVQRVGLARRFATGPG